MRDQAIIETLRQLAEGDKLNPATVVEAARDESSPLHDQFTWDDGAAAHEYRLIEARKLIAVHVELLPNAKESSPVWVSLRGDRANGGGYRTMVSVLSKRELREKLLEEAMDDLRHFQQKYHMLKELSEVFVAVRKVSRPSKRKSH
jgi:hypothetical protein